MKTLYLVIEKGDFDSSVCYADFDLNQCKQFCLDMIDEGQFFKGNWDIVGYDLDDSEVFAIIKGYFRGIKGT